MAGGVELTPEGLMMLAALPSLAGAYVVALIVGGGLILISAVFGGDVHHDMDVDIGAAGAHGDVEFGDGIETHVDGIETHVDGVDTHADGVEFHDAGMHLADWFSIRFVIYFAAMFGLTGTALTTMTGMSRSGVLIAAIVGGLIVGQTVHQTMRWLRRSGTDSSTKAGDYVNRPGRITAPIAQNGRGEVAIQIGDGERCLPAVAKREDEAFAMGTQVNVVELRGGTAVVVSRKEYEFLNQS